MSGGKFGNDKFDCGVEEFKTCEDEVRVDALVSCPKCGGTTGYWFYVVSKQEWSGEWVQPAMLLNGTTPPKEEYIDASKDETAKTITCHDCGKRISRKLLGN